MQDGQDHGQDRRDQHQPIMRGGVADVKRLCVSPASQGTWGDGLGRSSQRYDCCERSIG
jgi:hypothetical protein